MSLVPAIKTQVIPSEVRDLHKAGIVTQAIVE